MPIAPMLDPDRSASPTIGPTGSLWSFRTPVIEELEHVERDFSRVFPTDGGLISRVSDHLLSAKGKRFRPTLLLLTASMAGSACEEECIAGAVAVELIHTATLIHDDTIDKSLTRRGRPTVNSLWNEEVSILMGDYIYSKAFKILADLNMFGAIEILARSTNDMTMGEMAQIENKSNFEVTEGDYMTVIDNKTASLIAAACEIGAMTGGRHEGDAEICSSFGRKVGLAFQIMDDILDFVGDERALGKSRGSDVGGGDITLPLIAALRNASGRDRATLKNLATSVDPDDGKFDELVHLVDKCGGFAYSLNRATQSTRAAKNLLAHFDDSSSRSALFAAADYVVQRDY